ncbi:MAG: hypothetical protein M3R48_10370 [Candidatus Dormibacteraeota bacterium]|nr:hypothetical protein [Candidatus Dormibacteraeota bacterium]
MAALGGFELVVIVALVVLAIVAAVVGWDRYRPGRGGPSPGAHPTDEVFIDPETGRRKRVWFDPATGARDYRDD